MTTTHLRVWWWDGTHVADLDGLGGDIRLAYSPEVLDTWPANTPLLSCGLPVRSGSQAAGPFLRGVLPEGQHLAAVAAAAGLAVTDTLGLLARYGRDVTGALVVAAEPPGRRPGRLIPYSDETLVEEVDGLGETPLAVHDDSELSIAGLQDKLLLVATEDGWSRPAGGAPSTHILKLDDRRRPGLVAAEAACLRLADAHGKNVALLHRGDRVELAPLYDPVPTVMWPDLRRDPAMSIGPRVVDMAGIRADDIIAEARLWSHSPRRARDVVANTAERALAAVDEVRHDAVSEVVRTNAARLLDAVG